MTSTAHADAARSGRYRQRHLRHFTSLVGAVAIVGACSSAPTIAADQGVFALVIALAEIAQGQLFLSAETAREGVHQDRGSHRDEKPREKRYYLWIEGAQFQ